MCGETKMSDLRESLGQPGPILEQAGMLRHDLVVGVLMRVDTQAMILHVSTSNRADDMAALTKQISDAVLHVLPGTEEPEGFDGRLVIVNLPPVEMSPEAMSKMKGMSSEDQRWIQSVRVALCLALLLDQLQICRGPLAQEILDAGKTFSQERFMCHHRRLIPMKPLIDESLGILVDYIEYVVRWSKLPAVEA